VFVYCCFGFYDDQDHFEKKVKRRASHQIAGFFLLAESGLATLPSVSTHRIDDHQPADKGYIVSTLLSDRIFTDNVINAVMQ
jgi:hypothetical protein